jgi:hypothetical protein
MEIPLVREHRLSLNNVNGRILDANDNFRWFLKSDSLYSSQIQGDSFDVLLIWSESVRSPRGP